MLNGFKQGVLQAFYLVNSHQEKKCTEISGIALISS